MQHSCLQLIDLHPQETIKMALCEFLDNNVLEILSLDFTGMN